MCCITDRSLKDWFSGHRGYVSGKILQKATGKHFNSPGHQMADMEVTLLGNEKDMRIFFSSWVGKVEDTHCQGTS